MEDLLPETSGSAGQQEAPPVAKSSAFKRRLLKLIIGLPIIAAIWFFVGKTLYTSFRQIDWQSIHVSLPMLGAALACLILARLMNGMNCALVLRALGERVRIAQVVPIIWVASLGRYVPGKVTVVAGAVVMLMRLGVTMTTALAALFLSTSLMILLGVIMSTPLLLTSAMRQRLPWGWLLALIVLTIGFLCLHPRVFTGLCNIVLERFRRQRLPERMNMGQMLRAIGLTALRNLFLGAALFFAIGSLRIMHLADFSLALGSAGLASVAGFLAVFAPAGLGVHEAIYLITLAPLLGPQAGLLAVLFRMLHILADALAGAVGMVMLRNLDPSPAPILSTPEP